MPKPVEFHEAFARELSRVAPRVITLDQTGSTNDDARALGRAGAPSGTVVVANAQTAGRGRLGRSWSASPGQSLLASWIVRPSLALARWTIVPLLAGVAVAEAVRARARVEAVLKWPNDVLVGAAKVAGILVEADPPELLVVGIGVNVGQTEFPPALHGIATSLALEGAVRLDRADLLAAILRRFGSALQEPTEALERYRALCSTLGRRVRVDVSGEGFSGLARDVDDAGALVLQTGVEERRVTSGEAVHLREA